MRKPRQGSGIGGAPGERGQSELVGVVLLLAITVLGAVTVVTLGAQAVDEGKRSARVGQAEQSMAQLDTRASRVALGHEDTGSGAVDFGLSDDGGQLRTVDGSWMRVRLVNSTTGAVDAEVVNRSLGTVRYREDGTTVAYEGGGVWRSDGGASTMLSRPEFHFRGGTLTLPIVAVEGERSLGNRVQVSRAGPTDRRFPDASAGLQNRLDDVKVRVTVHSDYYEAWGRFFERSDGYVTYDHDAETATVTFLALPEQVGMRSGIIGTAGTGELTIEGSGAYTDSYNSSEAPYSTDTATNNGTVLTAGDVTLKGGAEIKGDVRSGDAVDLRGSSTVYGDVYYTTTYDPGATVTGSVEQIEGVATLEPIDGFVANQVAAARSANDNDETSNISDAQLSLTGSSGSLDAGTYYLDHLTLQGEELVLNTTDGDITVAVRDYVLLERAHGTGGKITVKGDGTVRVFVAGERDVTVSPTGLGERNVSLHLGKESMVSVPDDRSPQFRVYGPQDFNATITSDNSPSSTSFVGIIYAPAGYDGVGYVHVKHADVYGGFVTGSMTVGKYGAVHYDRALANVGLPRSPTLSRIEFLHVAVHEVRVEDS